MLFRSDEAKRKSNLEKRGLDFKNAHLVYDNPEKCTYESCREGERRFMDLAFAWVKGRLFALTLHPTGRRRAGDFISACVKRGAQTV